MSVELVAVDIRAVWPVYLPKYDAAMYEVKLDGVVIGHVWRRRKYIDIAVDHHVERINRISYGAWRLGFDKKAVHFFKNRQPAIDFLVAAHLMGAKP